MTGVSQASWSAKKPAMVASRRAKVAVARSTASGGSFAPSRAMSMVQRDSRPDSSMGIPLASSSIGMRPAVRARKNPR